VDYLQLMIGQGSRNDNRQQEIAEISRGLKVLARDLDVPVLAIAQLSRAVESARQRPCSLTSRSGAIEQTRTWSCSLYRDEYYTTRTRRQGHSGVLVGKHRIGADGQGPGRWLEQQYTSSASLARLGRTLRAKTSDLQENARQSSWPPILGSQLQLHYSKGRRMGRRSANRAAASIQEEKDGLCCAVPVDTTMRDERQCVYGRRRKMWRKAGAAAQGQRMGARRGVTSRRGFLDRVDGVLSEEEIRARVHLGPPRQHAKHNQAHVRRA
jgi:hypothetical protein